MVKKMKIWIKIYAYFHNIDKRLSKSEIFYDLQKPIQTAQLLDKILIRIEMYYFLSFVWEKREIDPLIC